MEAAVIIDPLNLISDQIIFGAFVTIENESGQIKQYQIVGEDEFNISQNKISWKSPVARALLGKKINDEARIQKPNGIETVTVIKISFSQKL